MEFSTLKTNSFRPDDELLKIIDLVSIRLGSQLKPDFTMKEWIHTVLSAFLNSDTPDNSEYMKTINQLENAIDEKEKTIILKDVEIREITDVSNENALIAQRLQIEIDTLKEQSNNVTNEFQLFSDENKFLFWCLLQVFKKQYPEFTFEKMIVYVFNGFQQKGFLKLDDKDKEYLETIKHLYNGTIS